MLEPDAALQQWLDLCSTVTADQYPNETFIPPAEDPMMAPELLGKYRGDSESSSPDIQNYDETINYRNNVFAKTPRQGRDDVSSHLAAPIKSSMSSPSLDPVLSSSPTTTAITRPAQPPPKRRGRPPKHAANNSQAGPKPSPTRQKRRACRRHRCQVDEQKLEDGHNEKTSDDSSGLDLNHHDPLGRMGGSAGDGDGDDYVNLKTRKELSRRTRIREKNRIAAGKCRSRQRRAVSQLTAKYEAMQQLNHHLCETLTGLEAELYVLKNMLMAHGNCDCELIQQYFKDAAAHMANEVGSPRGETIR